MEIHSQAEAAEKFEAIKKKLEAIKKKNMSSLPTLYGQVDTPEVADLKQRIVAKIYDAQKDGDRVTHVVMGFDDFQLMRSTIPERAGEPDNWQVFGIPVVLVSELDDVFVAIEGSLNEPWKASMRGMPITMLTP